MIQDAATWKDAEDVPQVVFDNAGFAMLKIAQLEVNTPIRHDEVRAILCALRPYSIAVSNYLDGEEH